MPSKARSKATSKPSGIIGNTFTYMHDGKQYVGILSGIGSWAGIGLAAGLTNPNGGLGAVGGYADIADYSRWFADRVYFAVIGARRRKGRDHFNAK